MQRDSAAVVPALCRGAGEGSAFGAARIKGDILFRKREYPLWNPKRKALIGSFGLERLLCLRNGTACARRCRVRTARRFASASIIRCRSADLVEVRTNFRLPGHSSMRRAPAMPLFRTQSAAEVTSLAPHGSKARLKTVTNRRDSWRSHVHRTHIAQRVQLFEPQTANVRGQGARPLALSWGIKRGPFSHVREWPPLPVPLPAGKQHASPAGGNYCFFLIRINGVHWSS